MAHTAEEYRALLQSLLPQGKLWTRSSSAVLTELLHGLAEESARIDGRMDDLIEEARVDSTTELLSDFELEYNLPDPGTEIASTTAGRRAVIKAKLLALGGQNAEYFEEIASALGYTVLVEGFRPAWVGVTEAGDPVGDQWNIFFWKVNVVIPADPNTLQWNIAQLIYDVTAKMPGHSHVLFDFYGAEYDRGFSRDFDSIRFQDRSWFEDEFDRNFDSSFRNAYDYDGFNLTGALDASFAIAFDSYRGGAFEPTAYASAYLRPT